MISLVVSISGTCDQSGCVYFRDMFVINVVEDLDKRVSFECISSATQTNVDTNAVYVKKHILPKVSISLSIA